MRRYNKQQAAKQQEELDDIRYSIFPVENEELMYSKWEDEVIWNAEGKQFNNFARKLSFKFCIKCSSLI